MAFSAHLSSSSPCFQPRRRFTAGEEKIDMVSGRDATSNELICCSRILERERGEEACNTRYNRRPTCFGSCWREREQIGHNYSVSN